LAGCTTPIRSSTVELPASPPASSSIHFPQAGAFAPGSPIGTAGQGSPGDDFRGYLPASEVGKA